MKIGIWHDRMGTLSGGCKCSIDSARALVDEHEITLYSYEKPMLKEYWDVMFPHKWVKLPRTKFSGISWLYKRMWALFKASLFAKDQDIIISTFGQTIYAPQDCRLFQWLYFPYLPSNLSFSYRIYRKPYDLLMERTFKHSEKILVFSEYVKRVTEKIYDLPSEQVEAIPLSIDIDSFEVAEKNDNLVVTTSSYCPWKHIEKVNEIAKQCPDYRFVVVGRVTNSHYFNQLLVMREPNVSYLVDVPNQDVKKILARARYYLHVNYNVGKIMDAEHFGIALIEGLAAGCTVLSHNSGGPVEILDKGKFGFLYNDHSEVPQLFGNYMVNPEISRRRAGFYDFSQFRNRLKKVLFN